MKIMKGIALVALLLAPVAAGGCAALGVPPVGSTIDSVRPGRPPIVDRREKLNSAAAVAQVPVDWEDLLED